jgi:concanavalin A-like lectin/glucanase superfamily protein
MMKAKLVAGLASAIFIAAAGPAAANVFPVGSWRFNEGSGTVAHDSSRHGNDGTLLSGAQWVPGRFAGALSFDGNTGAVQVPDTSLLDPATVTVSAWVNSSTDPGAYKYIVAKGATACQAASYGLYTGAHGGLEFYTSTSGGASFTLSPDVGTGVWDGRWHSVIGTFDGSTVRLYVDGTQVGAGTPDTAPISYGLSSSNTLLIGNYAGCGGLGFDGRIDQVRVFNRALGAEEIHRSVEISEFLPRSFPFDLVF